MELLTLTNPVAGENTYLLTNDKATLVVDPGSNGSAIIAKLRSLDKPVAAILLTHSHYDHIMSLELVSEAFQNP
ncbi:MBL fold metallo-hydrolase, partial [Psychrobacter sanguinis]|nr:MBL fold metallo-hydrolase [Psychrobacter sanguinis]